ncbi:MAG: DUF4012 domain-containing protein [Ktedonobacteraceae bacterium]|nr:DUF4012 domain-containing protein [Ktedonobacteraceae bacterium]
MSDKAKRLFKSPLPRVDTPGNSAAPLPTTGVLADVSKIDTVKSATVYVSEFSPDISQVNTLPRQCIPSSSQPLSPLPGQADGGNWQVQQPATTTPTPLAFPAQVPRQSEPLPYSAQQNWQGVPGSASRTAKDVQKSKLLLIILLLGLTLPAISTLIGVVNAYSMYSYAHEGIQHLNAVKDIFTALKEHPNSIGAGQLRGAQQEIVAAHDDFQSLHDLLNRDMVINSTSIILPQQVVSARALSQIGVDATDIGAQLMKTVVSLAPSLQFASSAEVDTQPPLLTPLAMSQIQTDLAYMIPRLDDILAQSHLVTLDALPLNEQQKNLLAQVFQVLPEARTYLQQVHDLSGPVAWMLGVDQPRTLLIETMDRAELRPTGGFTGQFSELHINGGRIGKFTLQDIGLFEENNPNFPSSGQLAPEKYRSWWPIPNWGLRDSNLSADFPTSAQLAIGRYEFEFGHKIDGIMLFSPFLVARVLQATGPITLPQYQETITALNLEARLHYYQLDNAGIRKEELVEHVTDTPDAPTKARKLFAARLSQALQDKLRHAQFPELVAIAHEMLDALTTKDLQVYVSNPQIESLLMHYGAAAQIDHSTTHDGLYVVQANVSANKASQYVQTVMHDTVTLNAAGGATHIMQMRLVYNQVGPVYGLDTYRDYVRVYVPPSAIFLWGNGFDTGTPLCLNNCPRYDIYGNGALLCPAGLSEAGVATDMLNDPYNLGNHPLDSVGPPTNFTSDEPQRTMFGGWVVVPKNCTATVSLSWYVPPMAQNPYTLLVQRQSSTFPELDLTLLPAPGSCTDMKAVGRHFDLVMSSRDMLFSLQPLRSGTTCYGQPAV